jgi:hypothetical protein
MSVKNFPGGVWPTQRGYFLTSRVIAIAPPREYTGAAKDWPGEPEMPNGGVARDPSSAPNEYPATLKSLTWARE